jgi:hypothetical protein
MGHFVLMVKSSNQMEHFFLMVMKRHGYLHLATMMAYDSDTWRFKYAKFGIKELWELLKLGK